MASADSHSDRSRSTWVQTGQDELRPLSISERERLVGVKEGDTAAHNVSEASERDFGSQAPNEEPRASF